MRAGSWASLPWRAPPIAGVALDSVSSAARGEVQAARVVASRKRVDRRMVGSVRVERTREGGRRAGQCTGPPAGRQSGRRIVLNFPRVSCAGTPREKHDARSDLGPRRAPRGCAPGGGTHSPPGPETAAWFADPGRGFGVDFRYETGATGKLYLTEIMGGGVAMFDADGDGDLDLLFLNGNQDPVTGVDSGKIVDRFFRNDGGSGATPRFADATESSGLGDAGYGMGIAVGDVDNDGDRDVLFTNLGSVRLYENDGAGRFHDVSAAARIDVQGWSCSAAFLDYDRDGLLDLYVTRYVAFDPAVSCMENRIDYCSPKAFQAVSDVLLHNDGDGRFRDVSAAAGITAARAPGLGVVCADLDGDGWIDIFVANDGQPNQLWINQRDGTFRDLAFQLGVAVNMSGHAEAGM